MDDNVNYYYLNEEKLPLVIESMQYGSRLEAYLAKEKIALLARLYQNGAILFRNFHFNSIEDFERCVKVLDEKMLNYEFRSTPRTQINENLLTSTEYPAKEMIPMHNEVSYSTRWPMKLWFYCQNPAASGGETPLVDSRRMLQSIDPVIVEKFKKHNLLYVRNYHPFLDLPWQDVFQTTDRKEVEAYCDKFAIALDWISDKHVRTKNLSQAVATHPRTKEMVWFNQAHLFHVSSLKLSEQEILIRDFGIKNLPRNVFYGNKEPISHEILAEIRTKFESQKICFSWHKNDVLLIDNMLVAHGRMSYEGSRKVIVAMSEEYQNFI